jgi:hypothetical protein
MARRDAVFLLLVLLGVSAACSSSDARRSTSSALREAPTAAGSMKYGRYFVLPGAPDPLACSQDKDCIGDTVTRPDGCCVPDPSPWPQTWAWHTWLSERRMSPVCEAVHCPPTPIPSEPEQCTFDVHCVSGKCANTCPASAP